MKFEIENIKVLKETDKAILVSNDFDIEGWVPKSIIDDDSEVYKMNTEGTLIVPEWFAIDKEWC